MISNCLISALLAWASCPARTSIKFMRNSKRRWHCYWVRDGVRYEFYAKGRSSKGYLRNLIYRGVVREF